MQREIPALARLDVLYAAGVVAEHDTGAVFAINEREPLAIALQAAIGVDEIFFAHAEEVGYSRDIFLHKAHIALPPAAGAAALACVGKEA